MDFSDLQDAWADAEKVTELKKGDHFISEETDSMYRVAIASADMGLDQYNTRIRRLKHAPVVIDRNVRAIIAEYRDDPKAGRVVFVRSSWSQDVWVSEDDNEVEPSELTNIRAVKDEGEYL